MHLPMTLVAELVYAVYSPMKHYGLDKAGMKIGVVGLGGLGHVAVLIGKVPIPTDLVCQCFMLKL